MTMSATPLIALGTDFTAPYNGEGRRATRTVGGVTTAFLHDGAKSVCEFRMLACYWESYEPFVPTEPQQL